MANEGIPIPQGVTRDTLLEVLAGWYEAGADAEPINTGTVSERTGHPATTARQTRFFESIGALEAAEAQQHRLTNRGTALAAALTEGDTDRAREVAADGPRSRPSPRRPTRRGGSS